MKKTLLLAVFLFGLLFLQTASAASNQGLTWGIAEGQTFTFSVDATVEMSILTFTTSTQTAYKIIMEIGNPPEIPADIDSLLELPEVDVTFKFENGTTVAELVPLSFLFVVPIGNWTLIDELYKDIYGLVPGITWIDDASYYGYSMAIDEIGMSYDYTLRYLKTDGFLYSMNIDMESSFANTTMSFVREVGLDTMTLIVVGGGAGIAIIVIAVIVMKMRA